MSALSAIGTWSLVPSILATVAGFTLAAATAACILPRLISDRVLHIDNDVKSAIFATVGVLYAVLLGFVAVGVWDRFEQAEQRTFEEASQLQELYRDSYTFPDGARLRFALRRYTNAVISYDWKQMDAGRDCPLTRLRIEAIDASVRMLRVRVPDQEGVYADMLDALHGMLSDRDARVAMFATGLNPVVSTVLWIGAFLAVGFSCLLGCSHSPVRVTVIGGFGAMLGLVLYLTLILDYPFRGGVHIEPLAFTRASMDYGLIDRANGVTRHRAGE